MSNIVDAPGEPEVRITAGSGSITVIGEARDDVVADAGEDVRRASDGAFEVDLPPAVPVDDRALPGGRIGHGRARARVRFVSRAGSAPCGRPR